MKVFNHKFLKDGPLEDRQYQANISQACLEQSTLVILPTGMGKTVIALRVILERLEEGPILLMAPTKPLAQQHADFLNKFLDVDINLFTGAIAPKLREPLWNSSKIIVSTPQEIALLDVKRGINMFDKLKVPILGLVDNMSFFETDGGKKYNIFGKDGVEKVAKDYKKEFLGKIPINIDLRIAADSGKPLVEENPNHKISNIFKEIATKVKGSFL